MAALNARLSTLHAIEGLDISRCGEYLAAWNALGAHLVPGAVLLDVGSYRSAWPQYAASVGATCLLLDPDWAVSRQAAWARRTAAGNRITPLVASGLSVPLADGSLALASAISTVEHIAGEGDTQAMADIRRVLRPDGLLFVSVPYSPVAREGTWRRWFQRWYDDSSFRQRLVEAPGLAPIADGYLLGGALGRFADFWYRLPARLRHSLSWSHALLFRRARLTGQPGDARVRWALLRPA
jgi:SAM-dependent methyltransferase